MEEQESGCSFQSKSYKLWEHEKSTKQSSRVLAANTHVVAFALRSKALYSLVMTWLIGCQVVLLTTEEHFSNFK